MRNLFYKSKLLPLFIIILGGVLAYFIFHSAELKPKGFNKPNKGNRVRIVDTRKIEKGSVVPVWNATGFVIPAESVKVYSRVSGNIAAINAAAIPGGEIKKGQWLAKLETIDFDLALKSQQAQLEQAKAQFSLEKVDQTLAKEELLLLNNERLNIDESLVLREPQLTVAKSKVSVAMNNLEKAKLNLARTQVLMPFDGKIINKGIGLGSKVSNNSVMFSVVNTEVYWLEVKIPHKFLAILDKQQAVKISQPRLWGEGVYRSARFVSILPELDNKDRQVKVLLAIDGPQEEIANQPQVFINDFLNVELQGKAIDDAWTIKHPWLQPDNTIWVVDRKNTLQKRAVEVLFKGRDDIYVQTKIQPGDKALAEKPGIASAGLQVRTRNDIAKRIEKQQERNQQLNSEDNIQANAFKSKSKKERKKMKQGRSQNED